MFDRFSDRSRKALNLAKSAALRLNHQFIGTEHILLGLVEEGSGVAANVLRIMKIDLTRIREEIEKLVIGTPSTRSFGSNLPFTPGAKKVLEVALEQSAELGHDYVGTEHLLLGLIADESSVAGGVLARLGLTFEGAREAVLEFLGPRRSEIQHATPLPVRRRMGRVSLAFAIHRAGPDVMTAALTLDQRRRIASILEQRVLEQLVAWRPDRMIWIDDFDVALGESEQLSDAQAKELIERHWRLPGVTVDAPTPSLADREMGLHFISRRRTFSLRRGDEAWLEAITLDDITLKVPVDVVLTWTIPRAQANVGIRQS